MPEKDTTGLLAANGGQLLYAKRRLIVLGGPANAVFLRSDRQLPQS